MKYPALTIFAVIAVVTTAFALDPFPFPGSTKGTSSDTQQTSLTKINRLLYDSATGDYPLNVIVTSGSTGGSTVTYTQVVTATVAVTTSTTSIRTADSAAVKTIVVNNGTAAVRIFEGGGQVATLNQDQTWESALSGKLLIQGISPAGTNSVVVSTYK